MKRRIVLVALVLLGIAGMVWSGGRNESTVRTSLPGADVALVVSIEEGEHFLHRMQIMPLVSVKNPPQMAVWAESIDGTFLGTVFVTHRGATGEWRRAPGDATLKNRIRRDEALPVWTHRRQVQGGSEIDGVTRATPKESFTVETSVPGDSGRVVIFLEVNSSTDFNDAYPVDAAAGEPGYSGGEWGSGQPSLIYRAEMDRSGTTGPRSFQLTGHGSPDGTDGLVYPDMSGITTARDILHSVTAELWSSPPEETLRG
jgi:hypothetical protein